MQAKLMGRQEVFVC